MSVATPPIHEEVAGWYSAILGTDQVVEVRTVPPGKPILFRADQVEEMVSAALKLKGVKGVYFTMNPLEPSMLEEDPLRYATDGDVVIRRWLLIDCDPPRFGKDGEKLTGKDAEVSTTDAEKAASLAVALEIRDRLRAEGWPEPVLADSGNGYHLLYRIDLPADDQGLVRRCLQAAAARFGTNAVDIDTVVSNPSRICKFYGTLARKGKSTKERPHRRSRVVELPTAFDRVPGELLEALADSLVVEAKAPPPKQDSTWEIPVKLRAYGGTRSARYVTAALHGEYAKMATAPDGQRNSQLYKSAVALAELIGPDLSEATVRQYLTDAAEIVDLKGKEVPRTIESGIKRGLGNPRRYPVEERLNGDGHHLGGAARPDAKTSENGNGKHELPTFRNFKLVEKEGDQGDSKWVKAPLSILEISERLDTIVSKWPKRVVELLFCEGREHEPIYLTSSARLFAWLGRSARVDWAKGSQLVTQEQFYEHLRMTAEKYEAIETLPHSPPLANLYYMHRPVPRPSGKLDELIDFYSPMTAVDRELIKAMILTWFWGGAPGARPAFQITGGDDDLARGRGVGKSKLMETLSLLVDGYLDVNPSDSIGDTKIRLLSSEARHVRVCRLDNLKAHRFSWGELEGFITAGVISGRMLYIGEGRRPNILTWVITVNGASMSKDMAQRLIPIMLKRPVFSPAWEETVINFINANRWEIIADVLQALGEGPPVMKSSSRWAAWERDVLSKTDLLAECQAVIKERQGQIDDDEEEADLVREEFRKNLQYLCEQDPDGLCVLIPSKKVAEWLSECSRKPYATNQASGHIRTLAIKELSPSREKTGRGWVWRGEGVPPTQAPLKLQALSRPKSSPQDDDAW